MPAIAVTRNFSVYPLLYIEDPDFAHWYELGVFWAMYGDYQGNGPYEDRYLIENVSRNIQAGHYDSSASSWFTSAGFYLGMLHGGWLVKPSDSLVVLTDPDFTEGYGQRGEEKQPLTDSMFISTIHQWALNRIAGQALAYELGRIVGSLSTVLTSTLLTT